MITQSVHFRQTCFHYLHDCAQFVKLFWLVVISKFNLFHPYWVDSVELRVTTIWILCHSLHLRTNSFAILKYKRNGEMSNCLYHSWKHQQNTQYNSFVRLFVVTSLLLPLSSTQAKFEQTTRRNHFIPVKPIVLAYATRAEAVAELLESKVEKERTYYFQVGGSCSVRL